MLPRTAARFIATKGHVQMVEPVRWLVNLAQMILFVALITVTPPRQTSVSIHLRVATHSEKHVQDLATVVQGFALNFHPGFTGVEVILHANPVGKYALQTGIAATMHALKDTVQFLQDAQS